MAAAASRVAIGTAAAGLAWSVLVGPPGPTAVAAGQAGRGVAAAPSRIVSFVPAVTEMLFAMGAGGRVVGVSTFDRYPPEVQRRPRVGGLLDPQLERVLSLRPDLVVVYRTQDDLRARLSRLSVPQFEYVHRDLDDVARTVRAVGVRVGHEAGAEALARRIEGDLAAVRARVATRRRPRTLLVIGREPGALRGILASGGYGFLHDLLELAGGEDVLRGVARESVALGIEQVLARAPEVIIEVRYGQVLSAGTVERARRDWEPLASVPAVRTGRVHVLQGDEFVVPGPRVVEAARAIEAILRGSGA